MDPLTVGLAVGGLALQAYGGISASKEAQHQAEIQQKIYGLESSVNDQRKQAMELSANRQQLENFRNVQRIRASGMNAAVNQGAQYGSGISGGQAQATSQGLFNSLGISQNLQIGRNIFGLNDQISQQKVQLSQSQSSQAEDQAWSGFGSSLTKNAGTISNIAGAAGASGGKVNVPGYNPFAGMLAGG